MHQETSGRTLELEAGDNLLDSVDGRSTGESGKSMREMDRRSPSLSAIEIKKAMCGTTRSSKSVAELAQKVGSATYHTKNRNANEEAINALSYSMEPAKSLADSRIAWKVVLENLRSQKALFTKCVLLEKYK